jgi:hypothetical protein
MTDRSTPALVLTALRYADAPPARACLAVLAQADDPTQARSVLHAVARDRPALSPLLRPPRWSRLVSAALAHHDAERSPLPVARSLARTLTLPPGGAARTPAVVSTRIVSAAVHLDVLASVTSRGWRTALISGHQLAVDLGMSRAAVQRALDRAAEWRWVALLPAHPGAMRPAKATRIRKAEQAGVWGANAVVEAMCAGAGDELRGLVASVRESCWCYAPVRPGVGHAAYLLAVAEEIGLDPATVAVTRRTATEARALLGAIGDPTDPAARAAYAATSGARAAADLAAAARAEQLEARRTEVAEARDRGQRVRAVLRALPACPKADADGASQEDLNAWITDADGIVLPRLEGREDEDAMVAAYRRELRRVVGRRGWTAAAEPASGVAA